MRCGPLPTPHGKPDHQRGVREELSALWGADVRGERPPGGREVVGRAGAQLQHAEPHQPGSSAWRQQGARPAGHCAAMFAVRFLGKVAAAGVGVGTVGAAAGAVLVASDEGAARTWECTRRCGKVALAYAEGMYDSSALGEAGQAVRPAMP